MENVATADALLLNKATLAFVVGLGPIPSIRLLFEQAKVLLGDSWYAA